MLTFWIVFHILIFIFLAIDLGVFNRKAHTISVKEAAIASSIWISLALVFNLAIYFIQGPEKGLEFLTGYLIEYSLSVDNIFVFVLIFSSFSVPSQYQHRVLFWGILTALILRGSLILLGAALISQFKWILLIFGAFLVFAGLKMLKDDGDEIDLENNRVLKLIRRFIPVTNSYDGQKFFTIENGKRMATPLLMVLLLVEVSDVMFAVDSIPAIFAITQDPFIVYTSNVFAILGLRSLYFLLAGVVDKFVFLKYGLAVVLTFVGVKLLLVEVYHIPTVVSLAVILIALATSIIASLIHVNRQEKLRDTK